MKQLLLAAALFVSYPCWADAQSRQVQADRAAGLSDNGDKSYVIGCTAANAAGVQACDELPGSHQANQQIQVAKDAERRRQADEAQERSLHDGQVHSNRDSVGSDDAAGSPPADEEDLTK
jgi:hypothetical protein